MSGADNQQERLFTEGLDSSLGSFLAGFAMGEASFMLVCRRRGDYARSWKISAAFNVSQKDPTPLELFRDTLGCGSMRRAGNAGWYWEVNRLSDLADRIIPFFERFPLVGEKARDFERWREAIRLLSRGPLDDRAYRQVLALREGMNRGGKRRHRMNRILRDYTPSPSPEQAVG